MIIELFSHQNGENLVDKKIKNNLINVIDKTNYTIKLGCGNDLRNVLLNQLKIEGWSDEFRFDSDSRISLTSYIDNHILCFQTGNMSRFYADLLKLQYMYLGDKAKAAFYIIPSKEASILMGSNIANFERLKKELNLFRKIITIPTLVIGIK